MKRYAYRAWGWDGSYSSGTIEASNRAIAEVKLLARLPDLIDYELSY